MTTLHPHSNSEVFVAAVIVRHIHIWGPQPDLFALVRHWHSVPAEPAVFAVMQNQELWNQVQIHARLDIKHCNALVDPGGDVCHCL